MKKESNLTIALLLFIAIFGITNIPNNYAAIGSQSITWFLMLALYFIPIALVIAELASFDTNSTTGISGWVEIGTTKKLAFMCGWAYFIENIFYLPMLASRVPVFLSWIFADITSLEEVVINQGNVKGVITAHSNPGLFIILAFIVIVIGAILTLNFEKIFDKIGKYIGGLALFITIGFIIITLLSVFILPIQPAYELNFDNLKPALTPKIISTLVWIIFAIGGIETIGSVVNKIDKPQKRLPKIVTLAAVIVIFSYTVGIIGLSFILTPDQLSAESLENAIPIMFAQAFLTYGLNGSLGIILLKLVMFSQVIITISALVLWLVATIGVLFTGEKNIFPNFIEKTDKKNKPVGAMFFTISLILIFLLISSSAVTSNIYYVLYDMSTIAMVIPFILLLISYINFKRKGLKGSYEITKNKTIAISVGVFLLIVTSLSLIFGVFDLVYLYEKDFNSLFSWFLISFGGIVFFLTIGYAIYERKMSNLKSNVILILIFTLSGLIFNVSLILINILFISDIFFNKKKK